MTAERPDLTWRGATLAMGSTMLPLDADQRRAYMAWASNLYTCCLIAHGYEREVIDRNLRAMQLRALECLSELESRGALTAGHA